MDGRTRSKQRFRLSAQVGFLLTEWAPGLDRFYTPGKGIAVSHNFENLADKIHYYLDHRAERNEIASAGYKRTCAEHTYDHRLSEVLRFTLEQKEKYFGKPGLPSTKGIDWNRFQAAASHHHIGQKVLILKRLLVAACSTLLLYGGLFADQRPLGVLFSN